MNINDIIKGAKVFQKILEAKITHKKIPIMTYLFVTHRCNLRCFYCYPDTQVGCSPERYGTDMSLKEIKNLIDELHDLGTRWLCLTGGEPLLREDVGEIIDYIHSKNIFCELISNGFFVCDKIQILKKLDSLKISLDGDEESNDRNRGKGTFKRALEGLDCALDNGITCRIQITLTKFNKDSFEYAVQIAKERNIPVMFSLASGITKLDNIEDNKIQAIINSRPVSLDYSYFLNQEELREVMSKILSLKKQGFPTRDSDIFLNFMRDISLDYHEKIGKNDPRSNSISYKCTLGTLAMHIDVDGAFAPCQPLFHIYRFSSRELGVKEAWRRLSEIDCVQCGECGGGGSLSILLSLSLIDIMQAAKYLLIKGAHAKLKAN